MGRILLGLTASSILAGLVFAGADGVARSALLAGVLCLLALLAALGFSSARLGALLARHSVSAAACVGFAAWALFGAFAPLPLTLAHPVWLQSGRELGFLSLAPDRTLEGLVVFLSAIAAFCVGALGAKTRSDKDMLGFGLTLGGGLFSIAALAHHTQERGQGLERLSFTLGSSNAAALGFGLIALLSFCLIWRVLQRRLAGQNGRSTFALASAAAGFSTLALSLACLMLTASRAGLVSTIAALLLLAALLWLSGRAKTIGWAFWAPMLIVTMLVFAGAGFAIDRLEHLGQDAEVRRELVAMHWRFFEARPWTGHGLNTFHELHASALTPDNWRAMSPIGSAHNIYVQALEETGLIGFSLLAIAIAAIAWRLILILALRRPGADWAALALASLALALVQGAVDFGLQLPALAAWVALLLGAFSHPSASDQA